MKNVLMEMATHRKRLHLLFSNKKNYKMTSKKTNEYWESRYKSGGNSGKGSYGEESIKKSEYINEVIKKYQIKSISDYGHGDCNQLSLFTGFDIYHGYDISDTARDNCKNKYHTDVRYNFVNNLNDLPHSDLSISLDVI